MHFTRVQLRLNQQPELYGAKGKVIARPKMILYDDIVKVFASKFDLIVTHSNDITLISVKIMITP